MASRRKAQHSRVGRNAIAALDSLARRLFERAKESTRAGAGSHAAPQIVVFVGAGASHIAEIPLASGLRGDLLRNFLRGGVGAIQSWLEKEVEDWNRRAGRTAVGSLSGNVAQMSPFEFAALLSSSAYGRDVLSDTIGSLRKRHTHRPLVYELLAHLAKHRFVDHFVSLNFDTLLDEALEDEIPERLKVVAGPDDVPSTWRYDEFRSGKSCFVVHPFGRIGSGRYRLSERDIQEFQPEMAQFFDGFLCDGAGRAARRSLVVLLIGYSGSEPAFRKFIQRRLQVGQKVDIFAVDIAKSTPVGLSDLQVKRAAASLRHVRLSADVALQLTVGMLEDHWRREFPVWIPVARHELLSNCFRPKDPDDERERLEFEVLLQAVKSRGFVHVEAFGQVPRLNKYSGPHAAGVLDDLEKAGVLKPDLWLPPTASAPPGGRDVPNYMLTETESAAKRLTRFCPYKEIETCSIRRVARGWDCRSGAVDALEYIRTRLETIERAPEIEIVPNVKIESSWTIGSSKESIESLSDLTNLTREILDKALDDPSEITVRGIWATGEWLLGSNSWALGQRNKLFERLRKGSANFEVLISQGGGVPGLRPARRASVIRLLSEWEKKCPKGRIQKKWRPWWEMNRVLTIVEFGERREAIYFRRRLAQPIVAPVHVSTGPGMAYLSALWERYWASSLNIPSGPALHARLPSGVDPRTADEPRRAGKPRGARRGR